MKVFWTTILTLVFTQPLVARSPIKVLDVQSTTHDRYGVVVHNRCVVAQVENLVYEKKFSFQTQLADGTWQSIRATGTFQHQAGDGRENWKICSSWNSRSESPKWGHFFYVDYHAGSRTFATEQLISRDRHAGHDLQPGVHVLLDFASMYRTGQQVRLYGAINLRNLAPEKSVGVRYSQDGWKTIHDLDATYQDRYYVPYGADIPSPNRQGVERWTFSVDLDENLPVQFAVYYRATADKAYWDNNLGLNYHVKVQR